MSEPIQSLRSAFASAELDRIDLDSSRHTDRSTLQAAVHQAISKYETCRDLITRLALFSPNESVEEVSSGNLQ